MSGVPLPPRLTLVDRQRRQFTEVVSSEFSNLQPLKDASLQRKMKPKLVALKANASESDEKGPTNTIIDGKTHVYVPRAVGAPNKLFKKTFGLGRHQHKHCFHKSEQIDFAALFRWKASAE